MAQLGLHPYRHRDLPAPRSVPVAAIVLTKDEAINIDRCLASLAWAEQVVVVDSGSIDDTVPKAKTAGAELIEEHWRGYGAQREYALRLPSVRHEWVYFVDADEWVSAELAREVAEVLVSPTVDGFAQRRRLVFEGRWIRHCGWYRGSWQVRLMRRSAAHYDEAVAGDDRVRLHGSIGRLDHDLVDEDRKGLAAWLHKHIEYAALEAQRRRDVPRSLRDRWRALRAIRPTDSRPWARAVAKDLIFPLVPARPLAIFLYMYLLKLGFLDGAAGLRFCLYHAWYQLTVEDLRTMAASFKPR